MLLNTEAVSTLLH